MPIDRTRIEEVARQIEAAFADVPRPGDDQLLHPEALDDMDIKAFYGGIHWRDAPPDLIAYENAALSFFSAEGFQFYLPAYMIWTLRNFAEGEGDATVDNTLYALDPGEPEVELHAFQLSKYKLFTPDQRRAVVAFLEVFLNDEDLGPDAKKAMDHHWGGSN